MSEEKVIEIKNLAELTKPQILAVLAKAKIEAKGVCQPPPLDKAAVRARAMAMPTGPAQAYIFNLLEDDPPNNLPSIKRWADDNLDARSQEKADIYTLLIHHGV